MMRNDIMRPNAMVLRIMSCDKISTNVMKLRDNT